MKPLHVYRHYYLTVLLLTIAMLIGTIPRAIPTAAQTNERCFAETGHCMSGRIRQYWEKHGGLPVFGFPITPQQQTFIEGKPYQVQTFERHRLELHPEYAPPYDVLLSRLGADRLAQQGRNWRDFPQTTATAECRFFPETGHTICGDFLHFWRTHGLEFDGQTGTSEAESLALFGLPLSQPHRETLSDGASYTVQWFERARFEYHPENHPPYHVLLGLLASEIHQPISEPETKEEPMNREPITAESSILSPPRATAQQAIDYIITRGTTYSDYSVQLIVGYYWSIGETVGIDPLIVISQNIHETDNLKSWWSQRPRRNPAGLGVTGETSTQAPTDSERDKWAYDEGEKIWKKGLSFDDWEKSARAHVGRLLAYALRDEEANAAQKILIDEALALRPLPENFRGVAPTMRGLNGKWAFPGTDYADRIARVANAIKER